MRLRLSGDPIPVKLWVKCQRALKNMDIGGLNYWGRALPYAHDRGVGRYLCNGPMMQRIMELLTDKSETTMTTSELMRMANIVRNNKLLVSDRVVRLLTDATNKALDNGSITTADNRRLIRMVGLCMPWFKLVSESPVSRNLLRHFANDTSNLGTKMMPVLVLVNSYAYPASLYDNFAQDEYRHVREQQVSSMYRLYQEAKQGVISFHELFPTLDKHKGLALSEIRRCITAAQTKRINDRGFENMLVRWTKNWAHELCLTSINYATFMSVLLAFDPYIEDEVLKSLSARIPNLAPDSLTQIIKGYLLRESRIKKGRPGYNHQQEKFDRIHVELGKRCAHILTNESELSLIDGKFRVMEFLRWMLHIRVDYEVIYHFYCTQS